MTQVWLWHLRELAVRCAVGLVLAAFKSVMDLRILSRGFEVRLIPWGGGPRLVR